jgi:hypothetical protein
MDYSETLMNNRGTSRGLVVTTNKGRPKGSNKARNRTEEEVQVAALHNNLTGKLVCMN